MLYLYAFVEPLTAHTGAARFRSAAALLYSGARFPCAVRFVFLRGTCARRLLTCRFAEEKDTAHGTASDWRGKTPQPLRQRFLIFVASAVVTQRRLCNDLRLPIMHGDGAQVLTALFLWILQQSSRLPSTLLSRDRVEASRVLSLYVIRW